MKYERTLNTPRVRFPVRAVMALFFNCIVAAASADIVCPDSSYVVVQFTRTYTGEWMTGQPYDYVTIAPVGGESFAETGIEIAVYVRNCQGDPIVGLSKNSVTIESGALCLCKDGNLADGPTDSAGRTTFSGTLRGGRPATELYVECDGVRIGILADSSGRTVKVNSPVLQTGGCAVDAGDTAVFATKFANDQEYTIGLDLNESGPPTIDASDLAFYARLLGSGCERAP